MKKYKVLVLITYTILLVSVVINSANIINVSASMDYNDDGVVDGEEKLRYMKEVYGVDSYEDLGKLWSDPNWIAAHGGDSSNTDSSTSSEAKKGHTHSYTATVTKDATCTEAGEITYKCSCGDSYTETIPMKPHDYETTVTKEPTCTETGTQAQVCKDCGDTIETTIPALGHKAGDWVTEKEPTCSEEGRNVRYCTVCGEAVETMVVDKLPHTEGEWEVALKPTLTKTGLKVKKCSVCGEILEQEEIPANTMLLYTLIGVGCVAIIGTIIGVVVRKNRR